MDSGLINMAENRMYSDRCQFYRKSKCKLTGKYVKHEDYKKYCIGPWTHYELCPQYQSEIAARTAMGSLRRQSAYRYGKRYSILRPKK